MKGCLAALVFACTCYAGVAPKLVWSGPEVTLLGGPSRDGRYLSYADPASGNLAVREIRTGSNRLLTNKPPGSREFAYFSTISPDSKLVVFAWYNDRGFYDLRVVGIDGANQRVLYSNEEAGFVQPCAWSPDGQQILTLFFRADNISHISLVPVEGGTPKILRALNWVYPKRMDISPDGRFVVYDAFREGSSGDRTLFMLSSGGERETRIVTEPGSHLFPLWTPAGKHVVYASQQGATMGAWIVDIEDGKAAGKPRLLRGNLGRVLPMGVTNSGELFYGVRSGETDVFVTSLAAPAAKPLRATVRFPGRNSTPAWSADGKLLAFLSRRGTENFGEAAQAIVIRSFDTNEERELPPKLAHMERLRWSPDSKSLLVSGTDGKGRAGLFIVDAATGAARAAISESGRALRGLEGAWSRDGNTVYFLQGETELRAYDLAGRTDAPLLSGDGFRTLAVSPDGGHIAIARSKGSIALFSVRDRSTRELRFDGVTELQWGEHLFAARDTELWRIPLDGGPPKKLEIPGNRGAGFSLHPDGKRIALTAGRTRSEVWSLPLEQRHDISDLSPLYKQALRQREKQFGPEHPKVARSASDLGLYLKKLGRNEEALMYLRRALAISSMHVSGGDAVLAQDMENVAELVPREEAMPLLARAAECNDPGTAARALGKLAALQNESAAIETYRKALAKEEAASGPEHPRVAVRLNDLALKLEPGAAEPLFRRALAIQNDTLGANHPETAITANNLANALLALGKTDEAEQRQRESLKALEAALGPEHPRVAVASSNLADILRTKRDFAGAIALYRRALEIDEKVYGPKHAEVMADRKNLEEVLTESKRRSSDSKR
jgi:Tol biopolymer transport system component/tetratricopeptide (TPR) repeat protein